MPVEYFRICIFWLAVQDVEMWRQTRLMLATERPHRYIQRLFETIGRNSDCVYEYDVIQTLIIIDEQIWFLWCHTNTQLLKLLREVNELVPVAQAYRWCSSEFCVVFSVFVMITIRGKHYTTLNAHSKHIVCRSSHVSTYEEHRHMKKECIILYTV